MENNRNIALVILYSREMRNNQEEIGLCSIASTLRAKGYSVSIIAEQSVDMVFSHFERINPFMISFTVYDLNRSLVYEAAEKIKKHSPNVKIFAGGIYPSYAGKEMLSECTYIDYAVFGEGEETCLELAESCRCQIEPENINGTIFRKKNRIIQNARRALIEDLDIIPFPSRDILVQSKSKVAQLSTSRGCFAACSFCAKQIIFPKWRKRSVNSIINELESLVSHHQIKAVNFIDASFEDCHQMIEELKTIAQEIISRNINIFYYIQLRAEFHRYATPELMNLLKRSGLCSVCVGIESGNADDLRLYNKIATLDDNKKIVKLLRDYNINVEPGFINFNPYSTFAGLTENINFLESQMFACNIGYVSIACSLYNGTVLYDKAYEDHLIDNTKTAGYRFVDHRIGELFEYVHNYIKQNANQTITDLCKTADMYSTRMLSVIACYEHMYLINDRDCELSIVSDYKKQHIEICCRLSFLVSQWFRMLLVLAEQGWDILEADNITNQVLSEHALTEIMKEFNRCKITFTKSLLKVNIKNAGELLDFLSEG